MVMTMKQCHEYKQKSITLTATIIFLSVGIFMFSQNAIAANTYQLGVTGSADSTDRPWEGFRSYIETTLPNTVTDANNINFHAGAFLNDGIESANVGYIVCNDNPDTTPCTWTGYDDETEAFWFAEYFDKDDGGSPTQKFGAMGSVCCDGDFWPYFAKTPSGGSTTWEFYKGTTKIWTYSDGTSDAIDSTVGPEGIGEVVAADNTNSQLGPSMFWIATQYLPEDRSSWSSPDNGYAFYSHGSICPPWGITDSTTDNRATVGSSQSCTSNGAKLWGP